MPLPDTFVLRSTVTSPFGRKVRMAIQILGLGSRITMQPADTLDENDTLRQQNPLGKMPALLFPDGTALYDSRTIIEFLETLVPGRRLIPAEGVARYVALTRAALADGIADAALLMVYEGRFRDADKHSERWLTHQRGKIARGLASFEADPPKVSPTDVVSIALSCALGYLDWRKPVAWRDGHPKLVKWLADFAAHEPAFNATKAPD